MSQDSLFDLTGRAAVVTGAGRGLGAEIAQAAGDAGAKVACLSRTGSRAERTAARIRGTGARAMPVVCDVSDEEAVQAAFDAVVAEFGAVDILYNNAGIADPVPAPVHECDSAHWRQVLGVDLDGMFYCCRAALWIMVHRGGGKVVNVASMWGMAGSSSILPFPAYTAAKGAVINLTRELGLEYARRGIQVNALCPGFYRTELAGAYEDPDFVAASTDFTPMGRIAEAHEIRGPALFLGAPASDYMTGQTLVVDGGCMAK